MTAHVKTLVLLFLLAGLTPPTARSAPNPEQLGQFNKSRAKVLPTKEVLQIKLPVVERMANIPAPLIVRDWPEISRKYYQYILREPSFQIDGRVMFTATPPKASKPQFHPISADHVISKTGKPGWDFEYFPNTQLRGAAEKTRVDPAINFKWKKESAILGGKKDHFSARWSGTLTAPASKEFELFIQSDDGSRVTIGNITLLDHLKGSYKGSKKVKLRKGKRYKVVVELIETGGDATMLFHWDYNPDFSVSRMKPAHDIKMLTYLGGHLDNEIFTTHSAITGAKLLKLDPNQLTGVDVVESAKKWYDSKHGVYRHRPNDRKKEFHSGIYGYWSSVYGVILSHLYPEDKDFQKHLRAATQTYLTIAKGLGAPDKANFDTLGFDFDSGGPGGRNEPMNRLGNSPIIAWMLLLGYDIHKNTEMLNCARSAVQWHIDNPGRYELTHVMAPYVAARLNAEHGDNFDLTPIYNTWFGDLPNGWHITAGEVLGNGITADGLDGAIWKQSGNFRCFTMGSLNGPAWLLPALRYDQRYAKAIAKYSLNMAVSMRLLQGYKLDWNHQDHKDWKKEHDPDYLLFYEALCKWSPDPQKTYSPYASGDPIIHEWFPDLVKKHGKVDKNNYMDHKSNWISSDGGNHAMYMGNHIGLLGAVCEPTDVDGIIRWDCLATEWHHPAAYPTYLYHNPFKEAKTFTLEIEGTVDLYDSVSGKYVALAVQGGDKLTIKPDQAMVLVAVPQGAKITRVGNKLIANGIIIDHRTNSR